MIGPLEEIPILQTPDLVGSLGIIYDKFDLDGLLSLRWILVLADMVS